MAFYKTVGDRVYDTTQEYTLRHVATHKTENDAWIALGNKVYDITSLLKVVRPPGDPILSALPSLLGRECTGKINPFEATLLSPYEIGAVKHLKFDDSRPWKEYTLTEVAQHSGLDDCWVVVNEVVYDVTSYVDRHPGGVVKFEVNGGKDISEKFIGAHKLKNVLPPMELKKLAIGQVRRIELKDHEGNQLTERSIPDKWYTMTEVAEKKLPGPCWVVVNDIVYDVTDYVDIHPGGRMKFEVNGGTDISEKFIGAHRNKFDLPPKVLRKFAIGRVRKVALADK